MSPIQSIQCTYLETYLTKCREVSSAASEAGRTMFVSVGVWFVLHHKKVSSSNQAKCKRSNHTTQKKSTELHHKDCVAVIEQLLISNAANRTAAHFQC